MASTNTLMGSVKTIATAHAEYNKSIPGRLGIHFKAGQPEVADEAVKLQADYARSAYETLVAESKKISELYTDFFKDDCRQVKEPIREIANWEARSISPSFLS